MDDDLQAISDWASIFKNPSKLATKVGLHYATHKTAVKTDISTLETDWDSAQYFAAGQALADVATILIGPINSGLGTSVDCGDFTLNTTEIADFLAGFVAGFTGDDYQTYFESCVQDTQEFESSICTAVNDFMTKDNQKMVQGVQLILQQMPEISIMLGNCPQANADISTVESWGSYWLNQGTLKVYSTAYKNLVSNISTVTADVKILEADYDAKNYYGTA